MVLTLTRGEHKNLINEKCYAYKFHAASTIEQDLSADLVALFTSNGVGIVSMQNQITYNRYSMQMRSITMQLAAPYDTDLMALHEAINEILDEHNADGELNICQGF